MILPTAKKQECDILIAIFDRLFSETHNTRLVKGGEEPEYVPATENNGVNRILFTCDYFSSALHEMAHWCVAGEQRRSQRDYGYWYAPDGRNAKQQAQFEQVEVKPQALEWLFSRACGIHFRVSADNLDNGMEASQAFKQAIVDQVHCYCIGGVNKRAKLLIEHFSDYYQTAAVFESNQYQVERL